MMMLCPLRVRSAGEGKAPHWHRGGSQDGDQSAGVEQKLEEMTPTEEIHRFILAAHENTWNMLSPKFPVLFIYFLEFSTILGK